jgi:hypothetical protein
MGGNQYFMGETFYWNDTPKPAIRKGSKRCRRGPPEKLFPERGKPPVWRSDRGFFLPPKPSESGGREARPYRRLANPLGGGGVYPAPEEAICWSIPYVGIAQFRHHEP